MKSCFVQAYYDGQPNENYYNMFEFTDWSDLEHKVDKFANSVYNGNYIVETRQEEDRTVYIDMDGIEHYIEFRVEGKHYLYKEED